MRPSCPPLPPVRAVAALVAPSLGRALGLGVALVLAAGCAPAPSIERAAGPSPAAGDGSAASATAAASAPAGTDVARRPVTVLLDWVPNTNHTGLYVAAAAGYFEAAGLDVRIVAPGEVYGEQAVVGGAADFAVSFQENLTLARARGVPAVSIAAILQHDTSAFATLAERGVDGPAELAGLRYGAFGSPSEKPTLDALMQCSLGGAEIQPVEMVEIGLADPLALLAERRIDVAWIFEGWQGIQAERAGIDLSLIRLSEHRDCIPDYYTPILIASEATVAQRPDLARAFVGAVARGYADAIADPAAAAEVLLAAAPELDAGLVRQSQAWLAPRYRDDAPRWGEQSEAVWAAYGRWLAGRGVIDAPIDAAAAFTNAFLPPAE